MQRNLTFASGLPRDDAEPVEETPVASEPVLDAPQEAPEHSPLPAAPKLPQDPDADEWLDFFHAL